MWLLFICKSLILPHKSNIDGAYRFVVCRNVFQWLKTAVPCFT